LIGSIVIGIVALLKRCMNMDSSTRFKKWPTSISSPASSVNVRGTPSRTRSLGQQSLDQDRAGVLNDVHLLLWLLYAEILEHQVLGAYHVLGNGLGFLLQHYPSDSADSDH
jgi:hypothetical protein